MLTFEMKKSKALSMPVLVEGINQDLLRFKFVIEANGVDYGFKAEQGGDNVKFIIPPLEGIIEGLEAGKYNAKLEVSAITEGDRGFFMQPWAEEVRIKKSVSVAVAPVVSESEEIDDEPEKKVNLKMASIFTEETVDEPEVEECEEEPKKKNEKLRKKFL